MSKLTGAMIIPTGLGCKLGGDAAFLPGVKLIAEICDELLVNPNAVNASDVNEMPRNCLYVEGSTLDRFLEGKIALRRVNQNRILMLVNPPLTPLSVNSANAGVWGLGARIEVEVLETPLTMTADILDDGRAGGRCGGVVELIRQVESRDDFDALAVQTPIDCEPSVAEDYFRNGGVNPWGAIEAIVSRQIAEAINKPVAHAPMDTEFEALHRSRVVARSMAPEIISNTYTFCVLKGLHCAPRIHQGYGRGTSLLDHSEVDFLLSPHGCWGRPHEACSAAGIPVVVVLENETCFSPGYQYPGSASPIFVRNYLEAAGIVAAMRAGVDPGTVLLAVRPDRP